MEKRIETSNVKSVWAYLKDFDYLSKEHDYINVTEWSNGAGWTIDINGQTLFNLTHGQMEAINYLTKHLDLQK